MIPGVPDSVSCMARDVNTAAASSGVGAGACRISLLMSSHSHRLEPIE
jgi:hypothetical protein